MDDIKEGSLVRAVKGSNVIEGVVTAARFIGDTQWQLGDARSCGYDVTVLEEPRAELQHYLDREGDVWSRLADAEPDPRYAPYTRLEPVPVTVQRVLDYMQSDLGWGPGGEAIPAIRRHFLEAVR